MKRLLLYIRCVQCLRDGFWGAGMREGENSKWTQQIHRWYANFLHFISEIFSICTWFCATPQFFLRSHFSRFFFFTFYYEIKFLPIRFSVFSIWSPVPVVSKRVSGVSLCTLYNVNAHIYNIVARIHLPTFNRIDYTFHSIHLVHFPLFISSICHRIVSLDLPNMSAAIENVVRRLKVYTRTHRSVMCHIGVCLLTGNTYGFMCQMAEILMEKKL